MYTARRWVSARSPRSRSIRKPSRAKNSWSAATTLPSSFCMSPPLSPGAPAPAIATLCHLHFDQSRALCGDVLRERLVEIVAIGDRAPLHAHVPGARDEIDGRSVELE